MALTILIVDDDSATRVALSHYLEMKGYFVLTAENGKEALQRVSEYHPHLVITDIMMPLMDGYELVRNIRKTPASRLLPVIFLSARKNTEERIKGYQLGCDNYLPKPFELDELGAVVRNLLERMQIVQSDLLYGAAPDSSRVEYKAIIEHHQPLTMSTENPKMPVSDRYMTIDLKDREKEVLDLLTVGLSNVQIGDCLHLSSRTVEKYVSSLLRKTGSNNRAELVRFAMAHHLVD